MTLHHFTSLFIHRVIEAATVKRGQYLYFTRVQANLEADFVIEQGLFGFDIYTRGSGITAPPQLSGLV